MVRFRVPRGELGSHAERGVRMTDAYKDAVAKLLAAELPLELHEAVQTVEAQANAWAFEVSRLADMVVGLYYEKAAAVVDWTGPHAGWNGQALYDATDLDVEWWDDVCESHVKLAHEGSLEAFYVSCGACCDVHAPPACRVVAEPARPVRTRSARLGERTEAPPITFEDEPLSHCETCEGTCEWAAYHPKRIEVSAEEFRANPAVIFDRARDAEVAIVDAKGARLLITRTVEPLSDETFDPDAVRELLASLDFHKHHSAAVMERAQRVRDSERKP